MNFNELFMRNLAWNSRKIKKYIYWTLIGVTAKTYIHLQKKAPGYSDFKTTGTEAEMKNIIYPDVWPKGAFWEGLTSEKIN